MYQQKELPRLTNYLRAYSDVAAPWSGCSTPDPEALMKKRRERHKRQAGLCSLTVVKDYFYTHASLSKAEVDEMLFELYNLGKEIAGSDQINSIIEETVVYLIQIFRNAKIISCKHFSELGLMFGNYPKSGVSKAFNIIRKLVDSLDSGVIDDFQSSGFPKNDGLMEEEFGSKIKFVDLAPLDESFYLLPLREDFEVEDAFEKLSFKFEAPRPQVLEPPVPQKPPKKVVKRFDQQWLESALSKSKMDSLPTSELLVSIVQLLKLRTKEELETELFDLLGYERIDLVGDIIMHRDEILAPKVMDVISTREEKRPVCMTQVVIQSETEKLLSKQLRKDEKRIQREQARISEDNSSDTFNHQQLKQLRIQALYEAQCTPVFHKPSLDNTVRTSNFKYPNVYDIYSEIQMSASFISGRKLALPLNAERLNNSLCEEIKIPAAAPVLDALQVEKIKVSTLDDVGQQAFKKTEKLNIIQSMVFDVAYNTNHNMLVCAPTGAGKTNIAMLTVIHEIKNNIQNGEILKNKFKIVYVAPMKALAAEMVRNFGDRLKPLGIQVKELTGDMQLSKTEIMQTQMLVTTPEKWDVVTRKTTGDVALTQLVRLLILDEVHLLDGDRGPVLEALVARTLRQVEVSQSMIRIIGLSATLPNYIDVCSFLHVNPMVGLYFFDDRFRPVPLATTYIGVKAKDALTQMHDMNEICYRKVKHFVPKHQVMVFVHARNETVRTASTLKQMALNYNEISLFTDHMKGSDFSRAKSAMLKSRNKELRELFEFGFAIHHAGMLRSDRNLVERYFTEGAIKVLVCTSTLAWGVNLPARGVIMKGTEVYDAKQGNFVDVSVLDVMQIFGRAGRPQYDDKGEGIIITTHDKLTHYLTILTRQHYIESKFESKIADNLNAEIALGTVSNVEEGIEWLSYTYFYVSMLRNPHAYGLKPATLKEDYGLYEHRKKLIVKAALDLDKAQMARYTPSGCFLSITDMGRTASHFYINTESIMRFIPKLQSAFEHESQIFSLIAEAQEFDQIRVREEERVELDHLLHECYCDVALGIENKEGKVNILLQAYLSRLRIDGFSLISDQAYVAQNATRIARALFEVCLRKGKAMQTSAFLRISKMLEKRMWSSEHPAYCTPLRQFSELREEVLHQIDLRGMKVDQLQEMEGSELGRIVRNHHAGFEVKRVLEFIPNLGIEHTVQPVTDSIIRIKLDIIPDFKWSTKHHGNVSETFWIWICDPDSNEIYHFEFFILLKKQVINKEVQTLVFTIPLSREDRPNMYLIRAISDNWLGSDREFAIHFEHLILPQHRQPHTDLLDLVPLPVSALKNPFYQALYKFDYFNPIQTQIFHTLYHTEHNVLLGAPTGSGKTIAAEIAMFQVFNKYPKGKIVYIAPLKALVRERIEDWKERFERRLHKCVVELTGDVTPDAGAIARADIIVTTPEKWDGVSRSWQTRNYVKAVALIVIDEIHLLGEDRGPVLEVIVSRTNFISAHTERKLRIVGLSTALANACDIGNWLGIKEVGLYNFRPSVRPVQLEIHVSGYHGKHYCPRMALMNKPTYRAIRQHSPSKPALVFVSSRRQTRLTALDLIAYLCAENASNQWVHMSDIEVDHVSRLIRDDNLKFTIRFGIGLHHAGLHERDRKLVEELFLNQKIQVLIATATLAWGINLPAHLVVVKGTEYFDGKLHRYVDFPITDVMQMAGRAGRPQFDDTGVAVVLVHDIKKNFYKKFLHDPFPVESSLIHVLPEHLNAEIVAGTINSKQQCLDYITWTYLFRRLLQNPSYYGLESIEGPILNLFLSSLINSGLSVLSDAGCIIIDEDDRTVLPTVLGRVASYYYLSHKTMMMFTIKMHKQQTFQQVLQILCDTQEYEELPVRHNEDSMNEALAKECRFQVEELTFDSPHTKANLLFQSHFSRGTLPCPDYYTDLKSILDQAIRIIQAMIDVAADKGLLGCTLLSMTLLQMIMQGRWHDDNTLLTLPHIEKKHLNLIRFCRDLNKEGDKRPVDSLPMLIDRVANKYDTLLSILRSEFDERKLKDIYQTLMSLPIIDVRASIKGWWNESQKEEMRALKITQVSGRKADSHWLKLHADQEYVLNVNLNRVSKPTHNSKAIAPKFPKTKEEGWFLVLGSKENEELIAMKRIPYIRQGATHRLTFFTPEKVERVEYKLYLISDSYLGLDQEFDICLDIIEESIRSQLNSELVSDSESSSEED